MPENITKIVVVVVAAVIGPALRAGMIFIGFGAGVATGISLIITVLLIVSALLWRTYPVLGIVLCSFLFLMIIAAVIYVNAFRT